MAVAPPGLPDAAGGIMVDSGAAGSACPRNFGGSEVRWLDLRSATSAPIRQHGDNTVILCIDGGVRLKADFVASEVSHPIPSVSRVVDAGFTVSFGPTGALVTRSGQEVTKLARSGGLYWLPARPAGEAAAAVHLCAARAAEAAEACQERTFLFSSESVNEGHPD